MNKAKALPHLKSQQAILPQKQNFWLFLRNIAKIVLPVCFIPGVVVLLVFYHTCAFGLITWGDVELGTDLPPVSFGVYPRGVSAAFQAQAPWDGVYGPLAPLSHALDFQLFANDFISHHLTSIWIHVTVTLLAFLIFRRISGSNWCAGLTALLVGLHPVQVPAVVWITQRRILLATLCFLATLLCWLRETGEEQPKRRIRMRYVAALIATLFTALAYPAAAIALAAVLSACELCLKSNSSAGAHVKVIRLGPVWFIASAISFWSHAITQRHLPPSGGLTQTIIGAPILERMISLPGLAKSVLLMGHWSTAMQAPAATPPTVYTLISTLACLGLLPLLLTLRSPAAKRILFGVLWFAGSSAIFICTSRDDSFAPPHWIYLASIGLSFSAAYAVEISFSATNRHYWLRALVLTLGALLVWRCTTEIDNWSSGDNAITTELASNPAGWARWRLLHALGVKAERAHNRTRAIAVFQEALAAEWDPRTLLFLGYEERSIGNPRKARLFFDLSSSDKRTAAPAETALAEFARDSGDLTAAVRHYTAALSADDRYPSALAGLAMIRATAPVPALRAPAAGLVLAKQGMRWTRNSDYRAVEAAAAAHAALGEFRRAQLLEANCLLWHQRNGHTNEANLCQERLDAYKAEKPWIMPVATNK